MSKYIILALGAMILYSIAPVIHKKVPNINSVALLFIYSVVGVILFGIILLSTNGFSQLNTNTIKFALVAGVLINLAFLMYAASIRTSGNNTSLVVVIRSLGMVFSIILTPLILTEKISNFKTAAILLATVSVLLAVYDS
ncbi:MAG: EamA family transporter [bacterium]